MKRGGIASVLLLAAVLDLCGLHTALGERPGVCPRERVHVKDRYEDSFCEKDEDCPLVQKCCLDNKDKFCKPPDKERPGKCPIVDFNEADIKNREDFCSAHSECANELRCCLTKTGYKCEPSFKDKPGSCPRSDINCIRGTRKTCDNDSGCEGNLKCCDNKCGWACLPPL